MADEMNGKVSPYYVQTSLAAALTLGLQQGSFHRNAKLTGLNLLLHYEEGCMGRCAFCGLSTSRRETRRGRTFIRVAWPLYPLSEIVERTERCGQIQRVCISMVTHPRALIDTIEITKTFREKTGLPVSLLIAPTLIRQRDDLKAMRQAGADRVGIAIDAATPELFDRLRGRGVHGPHRWDHYWRVVELSTEVFERGHTGIHLIVGLGETEREMVETIQRAHDRGCPTHLFSFYPEEGSSLENLAPPPIDQYRRIQLARWLINEGLGRSQMMTFDEAGRIIDFGLDISPFIRSGVPFMTSGCPGRNGKVACNRPYGNERPSGPIRNFPFHPEPQDIAEIETQMRLR
jgi:biotin synthase